jgi:hypothetical protein
MRKLVTTAFATCITMVSALPTAAEDANGEYAVRGLGSVSCPQLISAVENPENGTVEQYLSWTLGYITARSRLSDATFDSLPILDPNSVGGLVYNTCTANREASVEAAVDALIDFMEPIRVSQSSDTIRVVAEEQSIFIRRETLNRVLNRVQELGFAVKIAQGEGVNLADSLQAFQEDRGLAVTRVPDTETLIALFLS